MKCKLGDISEITKLAGYEFTKYIKYIPDGEIIAVRALNLKNGTLVLDDIQRISKEVSETLPRSQLHKNDIVLSYTGTLGECAQIQENDKYHLAPNVCKITPNDSVVNPNFLFQYIRCEKFKQTLINYAHGSTQPTIPMSTIRDIPVDIPDDLEKQGKIAAILSALDEKIATNRAINENLERQAKSLYKEYFAPVNSEMQNIKTLDMFCNIFTGKNNSNASTPDGKFKFFTCSPEPLQIDSFIFDGNAIIVSGNGAYTGRTRFYSGKFDLYQRTYACTLKEGFNSDYIFPLYWFVKLELSKKIMGGTRGSAIPYIVMNDLAKFEFEFDQDKFESYMPLFKSITETIQANENQNETLAQLRDGLLPRLVSGELDVSDIEL